MASRDDFAMNVFIANSVLYSSEPLSVALNRLLLEDVGEEVTTALEKRHCDRGRRCVERHPSTCAFVQRQHAFGSTVTVAV